MLDGHVTDLVDLDWLLEGTTLTDMLATFGLADLWCGVDVAYVQEVITSPEIVPVPRADASVAGLFNLRGQVLAAIDLRARMGYPARTSGDDRRWSIWWSTSVPRSAWWWIGRAS